MPVHIGEMTSEVAVFDGELPLSEAQLEKLVALVVKRLEELEQERQRIRGATDIRREARPAFALGD